MNKLICIPVLILLASSAAGSQDSTTTQQTVQSAINTPLAEPDSAEPAHVQYLGKSRAEIEKDLGLPHMTSHRDGLETLTYWKDEGTFLGHVKYIVVLKNDKVVQFSKYPTSMRFKADLTEADLHNVNKVYNVNTGNGTVR